MANCPRPAHSTRQLGMRHLRTRHPGTCRSGTGDWRMLMRVPFRSPPRLSPLAGDATRWLAPFLVAAMIYVAGLAGIGLILVDQTLRAVQDALAGRVTVQVPAEASAARLQTVLAVLHQTQGIRSVRLLSPEQTGRLLEPWLGSPVAVEKLPMPRLIDAEFDRTAAIDLTLLGTQVAAVVPDIRIDDYGPVVGELHARARPLQALFGAAIGAALLLVAALAVFATGAALASQQTDNELLRLVGAEDRQLARP